MESTTAQMDDWAQQTRRPRPYTVRRHFDRKTGITTYRVAVEGVRAIAGGPEFYERSEAQGWCDQRNRIEGRKHGNGER